jgi:hypothetical protein
MDGTIAFSQYSWLSTLAWGALMARRVGGVNEVGVIHLP